MISDEIKSLRFESWWVENGQKNQISIIFRLDGNPHEVIIKDTKYYVKELYSSDKRNTNQITVSLYSNHPPTHSLTHFVVLGSARRFRCGHFWKKHRAEVG